jgi:hypothetical protein
VDQELETFANELKRDVHDAVESGEGEPWTSHEFTAQVLERLADAGVLENPQALTQGGKGRFGRADYEISGFVLPDEEDPERVLIITTAFRDAWGTETITSADVRTAAERAARFVEASFKGLHEQIEPANTDASDLARRLLEMKDHIHQVRIVLITDCIAGPRTVAEFDRGALSIGIDLFDMQRLFRILGAGRTREDIELVLGREGHALPSLQSPKTTDTYQAYLAAVPGDLIADVYERYGTRLLELNVRAFLGVRGKKTVNAGLRETIMKSPGDFLAFNNGIVATVDSIEIGEDENGASGIKRVTGLQIVNGGQTTASLYRARRVDKADLKQIRVPVKFIHVQGSDLERMVASISRSANSQNTVQPADFSANDPVHVKLEKLANETWCPDGRTKWFYDRARGAYEAAQDRAGVTRERQRRFLTEFPKEKRFSKIDLAKYINAWECQPHLVCYGGQKNFQGMMQRLKELDRGSDDVDQAWFKAMIASAIVFRAAHKVVRGLAFPAYQANITAYLVSALSWRTSGRFDLDRVWRSQAVSAELGALLKDWAPTINKLLRETAGQKMPTEWSKREQCWFAIRARAPQLPSNPLPEIAPSPAAIDDSGASVRSGATGDDELEIVREVQLLPARAWAAVYSWGTATHGPQWSLSTATRVMAELATGGWKKQPTALLARRAKEGFDAWKAAGGPPSTASSE